MREIADHYDVLLISDEVICSWGRLGEWFGAQRYDYQPDIITTAKGITSAYAPMGAVIASDRVFEPFAHGTTSFTHGITFGGHPVSAAVALANIAVFEEEGILDNVRAARGAPSAACSTRCATSRSSATSAAPGYFQAIELVKDQDTKESFSHEESETLLRGFLSGELFRARPHLPRRRPRRPGRPALPAADRRPGAVRRDRGACCGPSSRRRRAGCTSAEPC